MYSVTVCTVGIGESFGGTLNKSMAVNSFAGGMLNPAAMLGGPYGGYPMPPADIMGMLPYLYPGLSGYYPGGGMPFAPPPPPAVLSSE